MKLRTLAFAAAAIVSFGPSMGQGLALAQTKIFVINEEAIRRDSKIGKDIQAKLGSIQKEGVEKLGLQALQAEIKTEEEALKPQTASLTKEALDKNATLKARVEALNRKKAEFVQKAEILDANLGQQGNAASGAFAAALAPAVDHVAKQAGADVVLSFSSTWYVKDAIDLSQKVVQRLDATTPSYDALRAAAVAAQPAARAAAPKPAAP